MIGVKLRYPIRYPKSFFKLLASGFVLAVLPLIAGLLFNMAAIQTMAEVIACTERLLAQPESSCRFIW